MTSARRQAAPLRFLLAVLLGWAALRGAMLGWQPADARLRWAPYVPPREIAQATIPLEPPSLTTRVETVVGRTVQIAFAPSIEEETTADTANAPVLIATKTVRPPIEQPHRSDTVTALAVPTTPEVPSRFSGSTWMFVRGGGHATPLSPYGQIGGGQAGARILYRLTEGLSAAARVSRTIGGPSQSEVALGLDWQPLRAVPVHLMLDRRIAIDRGGRDAWAAGIAGGAYAVPLAKGVRLDGYAQAGVVGLHARDLYADGAVRIGHPIMLADGRSLTLGGGVWGAAQPGAARLDAGPSLVLRVPVRKAVLAAAVDWRQRVAGGARPHSGVALTIGVDF